VSVKVWSCKTMPKLRAEQDILALYLSILSVCGCYTIHTINCVCKLIHLDYSSYGMLYYSVCIGYCVRKCTLEM